MTASTEAPAAICQHQLPSQGQTPSDLEELIQERNIIGPLLQSCIEQRKNFVDNGRVAFVVLVMVLGISWLSGQSNDNIAIVL